MKTRILVGLALAISIAVGIGYTQRASIAERLLAAGLPKQMSTNQVELLEDGLHVAAIVHEALFGHVGNVFAVVDDGA